MAEDAELQAQMTNTLREVSERMTALVAGIEQTRWSVQEMARGMEHIAPALQEAWQQAISNDLLWQARIDGPVYRQTPFFGRFRWYRQWRVWLLRRSLRKDDRI